MLLLIAPKMQEVWRTRRFSGSVRLGAAREAARDGVPGGAGEGEEHAVEPPGPGAVEHHVALAVVEAGLVVPRREPAEQALRRLAEVGQRRLLDRDQQAGRPGPAQQLLRPLEHPQLRPRRVDAQQAAAWARMERVERDAGDPQEMPAPDPFAPPRNPAAAAAPGPVDEGIQHAPGPGELGMHPDIGEAVAREVGEQPGAQGGAGLEGFHPSAPAEDGPGEHAVEADAGSDIDHRVARVEIAQHEADRVAIDRRPARAVGELEPAAERDLPRRRSGGALLGAAVDRPHGLVDQLAHPRHPAASGIDSPARP